jgi:hypothetical protein
MRYTKKSSGIKGLTFREEREAERIEKERTARKERREGEAKREQSKVNYLKSIGR